MLRYLGLLAALCMLPSCSSSTAAPATATVHADCAPAGAHAIAVASRAEVYSRSHSVYGCATSGGRYRLGGLGRCVRSHVVEAVALTGRIAAYALSSCGIDMSTTQVIVRRLSDGTKLSADAAVTHGTGPESIQSVTAIVLNSAGRVAWIVSSRSILSHRTTTEVVARTGGGVRLLDADAGIGTDSLRLTGSRLTWTDGSGSRAVILQ